MLNRSLIAAFAMSLFTTLQAQDPSRSSIVIGAESLFPAGKFQQGMLQPGFGLNLGYVYHMPGTRLGLTFDYNFYTFGTLTNQVDFKFRAEDNPTTSTISVNNYVSTFLLGASYSLTPADAAFAPYVSLQGGMLRNKSQLNITQLEGDDCEAMFTQQLHRDRNFAYRANFGVRYNEIGKLICKKHEGNWLFLDLNVSYMGSGTMTFMTTLKPDYLTSQQHANGNHTVSQPENPETPVMGTFKHIPSGEIHEHAVGTLYRHGMQAVGCQVRVGFLF